MRLLTLLFCVSNLICLQQSWMFRYGGRYLALRKITSDNLSTTDRFSMIAIENASSPSQKAYTVNARAIAVSCVCHSNIVNFHCSLRSIR
jgi:hypothetical protein